MRKLLALTFWLTCVLVSQAQTSPIQATITVSQASTYSQLSDTAKSTPPRGLSRGDKVTVLNTSNPRWVLVGRGGQQYYIRSRELEFTASTLPTPAAIAAVPRDPTTGSVHYSSVETVEGISKNDLYSRAKTWVIDVYNSPKDVITTEDANAGIIVCKGFTEESVNIIGFGSRQRLYFTVKISTKDGRYKYELSDFSFRTQQPQTTTRRKRLLKTSSITLTIKVASPTA